MTEPKPPAEVAINLDLISMMLSEFAPELVGEPIEFNASGWDNEIYRIGDNHAIRLPRRELAAPLAENEQTWMPELAELLPLPIPSPTFAGKPAFGYPFHWSIVPWLSGVPMLHAPPIPTEELMQQLADVLNPLHVAAPKKAPKNPYRGVALSLRADDVIDRIETCAAVLAALDIDPNAVRETWDSVADAPEFGGPPVWVHGDLHLANILVRAGRISALIDFGDLCAGDPAVDLSIAWMLFGEETDRLAFRKLLTVEGRSIDVHTWKRARGNALAHALAVLERSSDDPSMRRMGAVTLRNTLL